MLIAEPAPIEYGSPKPGKRYYDTDGLYVLEFCFDSWYLMNRQNYHTIMKGPACLAIAEALAMVPYRTELYTPEDDSEFEALEEEFFNRASWTLPEAEKYLTTEEIDFQRRRSDAIGELGGYAESELAITARPLRRVPFIEL